MAAGGKDVSMKSADATDRITKRKNDELAEFYSSKAADGSVGAKEREASMLFSVAEAHIDDDEDYAAALKTADEALDLFREVKDHRGEADTIRLIVHAHLGRSEAYRWTERGDPSTNLAGETERKAEKVAGDALEAFRGAGNTRGEACMLLSLAEISWFRKDRERRENSLEWATEAHGIFQNLGDKKFQAIAKQALTCIKLQSHNIEDALKLSDESQSMLHDLGETKDEAVSLHLLACSQLMDEKWSLGLATAHEALRLFRTLGLEKYAGFELYCIGHWLVDQDKARDALPIAKEAQAIFQKLGLGKGWQVGAASLVLEAHLVKGDKSSAMKLAKDELERYQASGDKRSEIIAHVGLVKAHIVRESDAEAMQETENALEICRELGDRRWEACMLINTVHLHVSNRAFDQAATAADEARDIFRELNDLGEEARALKALTDLHIAKSDFRMATQSAGERRILCQEWGNRDAEAGVVLDLACSLTNEGKIEEGMAAATEAQGMFLDMGSRRGEGCSWQLITQIHLGNSKHDLALAAAQKMQALFEECEDYKQQCQGFRTLLQVHLAREEYDEAVAVANKARNTAKKTENRRVEVEMLIILTNANTEFLTQKSQEAQANGKDLGRAMFDKAMKPAKEAVLLAKKLGETRVTASAVFALGQMFCVQGRIGDALKAAENCGNLYKSVGEAEGEVMSVTLSSEIHYCNNDMEQAKEAATKAKGMAKAIDARAEEARADAVLQRIQKAQAGGGPRPAAAENAIEPGAAAAAAAGAASAAVPAGKKGLEVAVVEAMVKGTLLASIGSDDPVDMDVPLMEAGMDSLSMVAFRNSLQRESGIQMPASTMFDYPTMRGLTDHLVEQSQQ